VDPPLRLCVPLHHQGWEGMISYLYSYLALILWICRVTSHAAVHRPILAEVGQQWIVHLAGSMVSSSSLHLHPPSQVRISRILSVKGGRLETYILKPRLR
jgi:hypothetical protein